MGIKTRTWERVDNIIKEQFEAGDKITSAIMHSRLYDKHGTTYLPNRSAVVSVLKRSKLLIKLSNRSGTQVFEVL